MTTLETLSRWLADAPENEHLEFKEAKQQYDTTKLLRYCVALAELMRRMRVCEEKGSGIDKVIHLAEVYQLPAPDFRTSETRTTAVLFAHRDFADMSKTDRIRACYQHCCLKYVSNERMSNQSLRERFRLPESKTATASQVISATRTAELIKPDESDTTSTRYARYLPFWA